MRLHKELGNRFNHLSLHNLELIRKVQTRQLEKLGLVVVQSFQD